MKFLKTLILILFLLTPVGVFADESGTLANLKTATGQDLASTNCCGISLIAFHIVITGTATVEVMCSVRADGGTHIIVGSEFTGNGTGSTTLPCTNIKSDVTAYTDGDVTVSYIVIH